MERNKFNFNLSLCVVSFKMADRVEHPSSHLRVNQVAGSNPGRVKLMTSKLLLVTHFKSRFLQILGDTRNTGMMRKIKFSRRKFSLLTGVTSA